MPVDTEVSGMVDWSEFERVTRDGSDVIEQVNGHSLVKVYRLKNGSRIQDGAGLNVGKNSDLQKSELKYKTKWKCDDCGMEFKSAKMAMSYKACDS